MTDESVRITERANELTDDIDVADSVGICRMMRACDGQMYSGYKHYASLADSEVRRTMEECSALAAECIAAPHESAVILSGAGTSGRLAFMIARKFNQLLSRHGRKPCFHYLLAGGDAALFQAKELAEDDPHAAVADLTEVLSRCEKQRGKPLSRALLIGITCGLSATYVGAQIEYALAQPSFAVALVGFNPVHLARKTKVELWPTSFHEVALQLQRLSDSAPLEERRHFVITPVVGPEAITGSTRLKGGTATKVIIEAVISHAAARVLQQPYLGGPPPPSLNTERSLAPAEADSLDSAPPSPDGGVQRRAAAARAGLQAYTVSDAVDACEAACRAVYGEEEALSRVVEMAAEALVARRRIYYLGAGGGGIVGLIDASEQVPTFGADPRDVQGFVVGGWGALHDGCVRPPAGRLAGVGEALPTVGAEHLLSTPLAKATSSDLLVLIHTPQGGDALPPEVIAEVGKVKQRCGIQLAMVQVSPREHDRFLCVDFEGSAPLAGAAAERAAAAAGAQRAATAALEVLAARCDAVVTVRLPAAAAAAVVPGLDLFGELAVKHALNVVSTGAHVLVGKVFHSRMVDVRLSNDKLFHRAVGIVAELGGVGRGAAEDCVLRAIYGSEGPVSAETRNANAASHVRQAMAATRVVPTALLLAGGMSLGAAHLALRGRCNVRNLIVSSKKLKSRSKAGPGHTANASKC